MGRILMRSGGGGTVELDQVTAAAHTVLVGSTFIDRNGETVQGTLRNLSAESDVTKGGETVFYGDRIDIDQTSDGRRCINIRFPQIGALTRAHTNFSVEASVLGNATPEKVLSGTTFTSENGLKLTGNVPVNGLAINNGAVYANGDYVALQQIPNGYYWSANGFFEVRVPRDKFAQICRTVFGIGSITNFSIAQVNSNTARATWANPGNGSMWSGVRLAFRKGRYPQNDGDGVEKVIDSNNVFVDVNLDTPPGNSSYKYFCRAWNYVLVNGGRWYGPSVTFEFEMNRLDGYWSTGEETVGEFVVPPGIRKIRVLCVGHGGKGGQVPKHLNTAIHNNDRINGGGGGGGGYFYSQYIDTYPGQRFQWGIGYDRTFFGPSINIIKGGDAPESTIFANNGIGRNGDRGGDGGSGGAPFVCNYGMSDFGNRRTKKYASTGGSNGSDSTTIETVTEVDEYGLHPQTEVNNLTDLAIRGHGQGTSTMGFNGVLYSGGGGCGANYNDNSSVYGGAGGGGRGGFDVFDNGANGVDGLGGGGGGQAHSTNLSIAKLHNPGNGGTGFIYVAWGNKMG